MTDAESRPFGSYLVLEQKLPHGGAYYFVSGFGAQSRRSALLDLWEYVYKYEPPPEEWASPPSDWPSLEPWLEEWAEAMGGVREA